MYFCIFNRNMILQQFNNKWKKCSSKATKAMRFIQNENRSLNDASLAYTRVGSDFLGQMQSR